MREYLQGPQKMNIKGCWMECARATVLVCKLEVGIFEETIHEHDEFAHAGDEGDFWFFASGSEAGIKSFEDGIVTDGAQGGHIKGTADGFATACDMTRTRLLPAIAIIGGDTCQGRSCGIADGTQFGQLRQDRGGGDGSDAGDGFQSLGFVLEFSVAGDEFSDGDFAGGDLFFQDAPE